MKRTRSSASFSVVHKKSRRATNSGYQTFDQSSVLNDLEESSGNLLGKVVEGSPNPKIRVASYLFGGEPAVLDVQFRKTELPSTSEPKTTPSAFRRTLTRDVAAPKTEVKPPELNKGDIVELRSCLLSEDMSTVYAWDSRQIAPASKANRFLIMPETLACIVFRQSQNADETTRKDYSVIIASRSEAVSITDTWASISTLKEFMGRKDEGVGGFILRGKKNAKIKKRTGVSFLRGKRHADANASDDQFIIDFIKAKGDMLSQYVSDENPWEALPLYRLPVSHHSQDRVEALANRAGYMTFHDNDPFKLEFVHTNVVLGFSDKGAPYVAHLGLSRSKPLLIDTALPEKARENKIKIKREDALMTA